MSRSRERERERKKEREGLGLNRDNHRERHHNGHGDQTEREIAPKVEARPPPRPQREAQGDRDQGHVGTGAPVYLATVGQDCYICKKGGNRAKDCPEKYKEGSQKSKICLKCGDPGHDLFSCKNGYAPDDLKEIQCYICKSFGHLCCAEFTDTSAREFSCYRCGQLGHSGLVHTRLQISTPTQKFSVNKRDHVRTRCVASDLGKTAKGKKLNMKKNLLHGLTQNRKSASH